MIDMRIYYSKDRCGANLRNAIKLMAVQSVRTRSLSGILGAGIVESAPLPTSPLPRLGLLQTAVTHLERGKDGDRAMVLVSVRAVQ